MSRAKRYPRAPRNDRPPHSSGRGRLVRNAPFGAVIETIEIRDREIQLHATKGIRIYKIPDKDLRAGYVDGRR